MNWTLTVGNGTGGGRYHKNVLVTLTANADAGRSRFVNWSHSTEKGFELFNHTARVTQCLTVKADNVARANFADAWLLNVQNGTGGGAYFNGEFVTVSAVPPPGGIGFLGWNTTNLDLPGVAWPVMAPTFSFNMVNHDAGIVALYSTEPPEEPPVNNGVMVLRTRHVMLNWIGFPDYFGELATLWSAENRTKGAQVGQHTVAKPSGVITMNYDLDPVRNAFRYNVNRATAPDLYTFDGPPAETGQLVTPYGEDEFRGYVAEGFGLMPWESIAANTGVAYTNAGISVDAAPNIHRAAWWLELDAVGPVSHLAPAPSKMFVDVCECQFGNYSAAMGTMYVHFYTTGRGVGRDNLHSNNTTYSHTVAVPNQTHKTIRLASLGFAWITANQNPPAAPW